jgi:hypothetical protein
MTDTTPSPDDARDELVSAVLDGEADAGERARVEADPELRARLEELRAVRDAVAAPVEPLDEVTALRLRRTAAATAPVARPEEPRRGARAAKWIGSVAAVVLLAAAVIPALGSLDSDDSGGDEASDVMSSADSEEAEETFGLDGAESDRAGAADDEMSSEATSSGSAMVDLGEFVSDQALARSALLERTTGLSTGTDDADDAGGESESAPAPDQIQNALDACDPPPGLTVTEVLVGQVDGTPRLVWVVELDDATTGVRVLDIVTCVVLAQAP